MLEHLAHFSRCTEAPDELPTELDGVEGSEDATQPEDPAPASSSVPTGSQRPTTAPTEEPSNRPVEQPTTAPTSLPAQDEDTQDFQPDGATKQPSTAPAAARLDKLLIIFHFCRAAAQRAQ